MKKWVWYDKKDNVGSFHNTISNTMKEFINQLIYKHGGVMLYWDKEKLYLLHNHHKHLDPEDAMKVLLGPAPFLKQLRWRPSNRKKLAYIAYCPNDIEWK